MNTNYGGVVCKPAGNVQRQISRVSVEDSADDLHASAPSEREAYWREQMADAAPSPTDVHYREN